MECLCGSSSVVERLLAKEKVAGSTPVCRSMYYTYILYSKQTQHFYIDSTNNLIRQLTEHNANKTISLKGKGPFWLVFKEIFNTKRAAMRREFEIKSFKGGNAFHKLFQ